MESFRTPIPVSRAPTLTTSSPFVSLGSCFADSIGSLLLQNKWPGLSNPFGTLFHPCAIFDLLKPSTDLEQDLFLKTPDHVHHYRFPKTFFAASETAFREKVQTLKTGLHQTLAKPGSTLLLTLGTSVLYTLGNDWVGNCHQQPARLFNKHTSTITDMMQAWERALSTIPIHTQIIVTVSPVRHLKEGLVASSLSKSQLRIVAELMTQSDPRRIHYFPAYEIMMDELRDYRFYARDMLHPNEQAIDFIWQHFQDTFFTNEAKDFVRDWQKIRNRMNHRPLHPGSVSHRNFLSQLLKDMESYAHLDLEFEKKAIQRQLSETD